MNNSLTNYEIVDKLDFRNNRKQLINSYMLRLLGLVLFSFIFGAIAYWHHSETTIQTLFNLEIKGLQGFVSIFLLVLDVVFVLYLHELIHATVFYITHKQKPKIGFTGFVIYAAAPRQVLTKTQLTINALTPFAVISGIGIILMFVIPIHYIAWVYIPTLVNASAAGGDFMMVFFVKKHPKNFRYNDVGDILNVLKPIE